MNILRHFEETRRSNGLGLAFLSILPDLFVLGQLIPSRRFRLFCRNLHNTKEGVAKMEQLNGCLGRAWSIHREQDLASHDFSYEYEKSIPDGSILLFSGGLDSFITWRLLDQPRAVYFAIGHKAQEKEIGMINRIRQDFSGEILIDRRLNLSDIELGSGYIPYRNLFFIMMASYYSSDVVLAQIAEWAPDKNSSFYRQAERLLREITRGTFQQMRENRVRVYAPYAELTKTELVGRYLERFSAEDLTRYTVSCYSSSRGNCGKCNSCISRYVAMKNNGIVEDYETMPDVKSLRSRLSWRDFRFSQLRMYIKRYFEMREYLGQ